MTRATPSAGEPTRPIPVRAAEEVGLSFGYDQVVIIAIGLAARWLHPKPNPTASERITARGAGWQEPVPRGGGKEAIRNQECVFLLSSSEAPATP